MSRSHIELDMNVIVLDTQYQPREELWPDQVDHLVNSNPADWPPILVTPCQSGKYCVVDGWHRYAAAEYLGKSTLLAEIQPDATVLTAYEANIRHGMPLTTAERKRYAVLLHAANPELSYRELGHRVGLDGHTVKAALEEPAKIPQQSTRQAYEPSGHTPDALDKLLGLIERACIDNTGVNKLAQVFSGKSDAQQRAEAIRRRLETYKDDKRKRMIEAAQTIGQALVDGSQLAAQEKRPT